jgi:hypothetical protein
MRIKKNDDQKKSKISITIDKMIDEIMNKEMVNKSRLIEKLLKEYYDKKNLY